MQNQFNPLGWEDEQIDKAIQCIENGLPFITVIFTRNTIILESEMLNIYEVSPIKPIKLHRIHANHVGFLVTRFVEMNTEFSKAMKHIIVNSHKVAKMSENMRKLYSLLETCICKTNSVFCDEWFNFKSDSNLPFISYEGEVEPVNVRTNGDAVFRIRLQGTYNINSEHKFISVYEFGVCLSRDVLTGEKNLLIETIEQFMQNKNNRKTFNVIELSYLFGRGNHHNLKALVSVMTEAIKQTEFNITSPVQPTPVTLTSDQKLEQIIRDLKQYPMLVNLISDYIDLIDNQLHFSENKG